MFTTSGPGALVLNNVVPKLFLLMSDQNREKIRDYLKDKVNWEYCCDINSVHDLKEVVDTQEAFDTITTFDKCVIMLGDVDLKPDM